MGNGIERRQFGRLNLLAHGRGRVCTVEYRGGAAKADLIDISAGGARIKCIPPCPGEDIRKVRLHVENINDNGLLQRLEGEVRWRSGQELGIQFHSELDVGLRTLQDLVG